MTTRFQRLTAHKLAVPAWPPTLCQALRMTDRVLHIAAYDVSNNVRLREALKILKEYASGRQKSVFECFLTPSERQELLRRMRDLLDPDEDRFLILRLDPRGKIRTRGKAVKPQDPPWFYVG